MSRRSSSWLLRWVAAAAIAAALLAGCENAQSSFSESFSAGLGSGWQEWKWERDDNGMWGVQRISPEKRIVQTVASSLPDERREAVNWLGTPQRSAPEAVVKLLGRILKEDPDPTVRAAAARALGASISLESVEPLVGGCNDSNNFVRLDSARSLASKAGDNAKRALLVRLAKDPDPLVRAAAATGLRNFHDRRVAESLIAALRDPDFTVNYQAEDSLIHMTGQTFEYDPGAWSRWLVGTGPTGDPFARAGQVPARLQQTQRPWTQRMQDALRRAWYWWQADEKPAN